MLIQPHSAPLEMTFYEAKSEAAAFPAEYRGDAFVALHGSWNRGKRTGYKVVRVTLDERRARPANTRTSSPASWSTTTSVWGRPVGVAVAHDGALLVTDDGGGMLWRVTYAHQ